MTGSGIDGSIKGVAGGTVGDGGSVISSTIFINPRVNIGTICVGRAGAGGIGVSVGAFGGGVGGASAGEDGDKTGSGAEGLLGTGGILAGPYPSAAACWTSRSKTGLHKGLGFPKLNQAIGFNTARFLLFKPSTTPPNEEARLEAHLSQSGSNLGYTQSLCPQHCQKRCQVGGGKRRCLAIGGYVTPSGGPI